MRRLFFSLLAMMFAGTLVGCWHIAGVCDCIVDRDPCLPFCGPNSAGLAVSGGGCGAHDIAPAAYTVPPVTNVLPPPMQQK